VRHSGAKRLRNAQADEAGGGQEVVQPFGYMPLNGQLRLQERDDVTRMVVEPVWLSLTGSPRLLLSRHHSADHGVR
jgi:hypothetical protein